MAKKTILFCDLDGTLIDTISGDTFPRGIWDMQPKLFVWDHIKKLDPDYLFIVTNQGGIPKYVSEESFELKLDYIQEALCTYVCNDGHPLESETMYCASINKNDKFRKPNTGMFEHLTDLYQLIEKGYTKENMLMIGDASGKPGDFSDSDKRAAENYGIDYLDVKEFIKEY